jgi:MFS family permease
LAISVSTDPRLVAIVTTAGTLPWLLFGLLGGALADRLDRRRVMWLVDAIRGMLMVGFVGWVATGKPTIAVLATVAFLIGTGRTVYDSAATALLPGLVPLERLPTANSRLVTSTMLTGQLIGPGVAGLLFALAPELPLGIDAGSFLLAALLIAGVRTPPTRRSVPDPYQPARSRRLRTEIREGLGFLWRDTTLRTLTVLIMVLAAASGGLIAVLALYSTQRLHVGSIGYGLLFSSYAVGGIMGGLGAPRLLGRQFAGRPLVAVLTLTVGSFVGLAQTTTAVVADATLLVFGVAAGLWFVLSASMFQTHTPPHLLGRISSSYRAASAAASVLGSAGVGFVAHAVGIRTTLLICAALIAATGLLARASIAAARLMPESTGDSRNGDREQAMDVADRPADGPSVTPSL